MLRRVLATLAILTIIAYAETGVAHAFLGIPGIGGVCVGSPCIVYDAAQKVQNEITARTQQLINVVQKAQQHKFVKMSRRLAEYGSTVRYAVHEAMSPEWRIHDWFTGANEYANAYLSTLTYGQGAREGFTEVAMPRRDGAMPRRMTESAREYVRRIRATVDAADSVLQTSARQTGAIRYNSRKEDEAIMALQDAVLDGNDNDGLTVVMEHVSGASLIEANNKQARISLLTATLENLLVESKRQRDLDAVTLNRRLNAVPGEEASIIDNAETVLRQWRLP